jgi:hypothetical protein
MSTVSLPSYAGATAHETPSYSAEPHHNETSLAHGRRPPAGAFARITHPHAFADTEPLLPFPTTSSAEFVKESKRGGLRLRLKVSGQAGENVALPVFGARGPVEGTLEVLKPQDLAYVAVRVSVFSPQRGKTLYEI